jgi:hypothetical protein
MVGILYKMQQGHINHPDGMISGTPPCLVDAFASPYSTSQYHTVHCHLYTYDDQITAEQSFTKTDTGRTLNETVTSFKI